MAECDICLHPQGKIKEYDCYQPTEQKTYKKKVCQKCINNLVSRYFSMINVL